jgi:hypothetical protein
VGVEHGARAPFIVYFADARRVGVARLEGVARGAVCYVREWTGCVSAASEFAEHAGEEATGGGVAGRGVQRVGGFFAGAGIVRVGGVGAGVVSDQGGKGGHAAAYYADIHFEKDGDKRGDELPDEVAVFVELQAVDERDYAGDARTGESY